MDCRSLDHDAKIFEVIEAYCQSSQNRMTLHSGEQRINDNKHFIVTDYSTPSYPIPILQPPHIQMSSQSTSMSLSPSGATHALMPIGSPHLQDPTLIVAPPKLTPTSNPKFSPKQSLNRIKQQMSSRPLPQQPSGIAKGQHINIVANREELSRSHVVHNEDYDQSCSMMLQYGFPYSPKGHRKQTMANEQNASAPNDPLSFHHHVKRHSLPAFKKVFVKQNQNDAKS